MGQPPDDWNRNPCAESADEVERTAESLGLASNAIDMRVICSIVLASLISAAGATSQTPTYVEDPESYEVYASLLPDEWIVTAAHAKTLVFRQETGTNPRCMPSGGAYETLWRSVVEDFRKANATVRLLKPGFPMTPPYIVVPKARIDAAFTAAKDDPMFGWSGFYRTYPESGGYMIVSAVGFSEDRKRAMVYMSHHCGSLCGGGTHHLLQKFAGIWREAVVPGMSNCAWAS
jgi:hypothetical protein